VTNINTYSVFKDDAFLCSCEESGKPLCTGRKGLSPEVPASYLLISSIPLINI